MALPDNTSIRPIQPDDDAAMAAIIRTVMPEFGATGCGFAISDPEVDWMSRAYAEPRHAYFVVERDGRVIGGAGVAPLAGDDIQHSLMVLPPVPVVDVRDLSGAALGGAPLPIIVGIGALVIALGALPWLYMRRGSREGGGRAQVN